MIREANSRLVKELDQWLNLDTQLDKVPNQYDYTETYNLTEEEGVRHLDDDSALACMMVKSMRLNHDIDSRHYSTVINGDTIVDMVDVKWSFWR